MSSPPSFPRAPDSNWPGVAQLGLLATIAGLFLITGLNVHLSEPGPAGSHAQVLVPVAARDIPVGTLLTRKQLPEFVTLRKERTELLPPAFVTDRNDLVDKRLSRAVRAGETFNPADIYKGKVLTLPPGMQTPMLQLTRNASAPWVSVGNRVDIVTTQVRGQPVEFLLLLDVLIVADDTTPSYVKTVPGGQYNLSLAVDEKQAELLALARSRPCALTYRPHGPAKASGEGYDIERVRKRLLELAPEIAPPPRPKFEQ